MALSVYLWSVVAQDAGYLLHGRPIEHRQLPGARPEVPMCAMGAEWGTIAHRPFLFYHLLYSPLAINSLPPGGVSWGSSFPTRVAEVSRHRIPAPPAPFVLPIDASLLFIAIHKTLTTKPRRPSYFTPLPREQHLD